ncbi:MAG: addiction module toxin, HicA family [Chloroflexota bacterium]|nr:MAG: addiction module toxin, HicA family [Chloroflexota bacterium]
MSPKLPRVTAMQTIRALHRDGWYDDEQAGSHLSLRHSQKPGKVIIPVHAGKTLKPGLLARILKDSDLTVDEFRRLL